MFIPKQYKLEEGQVIENGNIEVKCSICGDRFAVPAELADQLGDKPVCENESCKETYEKNLATTSANEMNADTNAKTADEINKALGN